MQAAKPALQLDKYFIDELHVTAIDRAPTDPAGDRGLINVSFNIMEHTRLRGKYRLSLRIDYSSPSDEAQSPYEIHACIQGVFSFPTMKRVGKRAIGTLAYNGSAILYGLLRGHVAQITGLGIHGPFLLPTVNLMETLRKGTESPRN